MDISWPEKKINVEIDGPSHLEFEDKRRDEYLKGKGWKIYRIRVEEIYSGRNVADLVREWKKLFDF